MPRFYYLMWTVLLLEVPAGLAVAGGGQGNRTALRPQMVHVRDSLRSPGHLEYSLTHGVTRSFFLVPRALRPELDALLAAPVPRPDRRPGRQLREAYAELAGLSRPVEPPPEQPLSQEETLHILRERSDLILSVRTVGGEQLFTRFVPRFQSVQTTRRSAAPTAEGSGDAESLLAPAGLEHWLGLAPPPFADLGYYSTRHWSDDAWWHLQIVGPRSPRGIASAIPAQRLRARLMIEAAAMLPLLAEVERKALLGMNVATWEAIVGAETEEARDELLAAHLAHHGVEIRDRSRLWTLREFKKLVSRFKIPLELLEGSERASAGGIIIPRLPRLHGGRLVLWNETPVPGPWDEAPRGTTATGKTEKVWVLNLDQDRPVLRRALAVQPPVPATTPRFSSVQFGGSRVPVQHMARPAPQLLADSSWQIEQERTDIVHIVEALLRGDDDEKLVTWFRRHFAR
jgi:hypothetical protein